MSDRVKCSKCGGDDVIAYASEATAICPKCCPEHDFMYERHERWWFCDKCGDAASQTWVAERAQDG